MLGAVALALVAASATRGLAQTAVPVVLPSTFSTPVGGGTATTTGQPCATGSPYTATDVYGDGCPATQATFSADMQAGVVTDPEGNVYIGDTAAGGGAGGTGLIRKYDPHTGLMSVVVGGGSVCTGALDKMGDGCAIANTGGFNNPRGLGVDPYGNLVIAGYGDYTIHMVCNKLSPVCTSGLLGTMQLVAGCVTGIANSGTTGSIGDGTLAISTSGTCTVAVNTPRGAFGDAWDNVYISDTGNKRYRVVLGPNATVNGVTNPLYGIMTAAYGSATSGYIYGLFGAGTGGNFTAPSTASGPCRR